jgi:hypothetical protein
MHQCSSCQMFQAHVFHFLQDKEDAVDGHGDKD